ncbi:MAG TPA: polysaccharide biosynthesis tyrosine autokinase [Candidatus Acidoferrum sp.]|jgi:exopolysaccharide transport family protein|nr:polysaccharide biosynthesis tyrosine autokinase [Candidatus Acidoferrum sp.]
MSEEHKIEAYGRSRSNHGLSGPFESRILEFADSYEILEPRETPDFHVYVRILRKRLPTILIVFFVLFTMVLVATLKQKAVYRAQVLLEIQKENPDIPTLQELYEVDSVSDAYLRSQYTILSSESLARRVIDQLGLDAVEEFNAPKWWSWHKKKNAATSQMFTAGPSHADREVYQRALERFEDRLTVDPVNRSRLVAIQFDSRDPELAARVANSLADNYIEQNLQGRWEATQKAADWLSQQLLGVKAKLEKSEEELQNYALRNDLVFLETDKGPSRNIENEQVQQLQEELTKAEADRYEKEALHRLVEAGAYESLPGIFENKVIQDLTERLAELRREHAKLSTTFNADYPRVQEIQNQMDEVAGAIQEQRKNATGRINDDYFAAVRREDLVREALREEQKRMHQVAAQAVQYNILKREVDTNKQLYEGLLQRLKEASVSASLKASNIRIVDAAEAPTKPIRPKIPLNLGVAAILGLGLGVSIAFVQERLDDTVKGTDDVKHLLGLTAVGLIPAVPQLDGSQGASQLLEHGKPRKENGNGSRPNAAWHRIDAPGTQHAALVEAFRSLRTAILLSTADHPPSSLLVSSTQPGEGKTTIAANLAIALAQAGHRVLVVDADLRSPSLHRLFGMRENLGLVSYLTGHQDWRSVVRPSGLPGLDLLLCGPIPPNPSELLSSRNMGALIRSGQEQYEFIILDSAPMLALADSRIMATLVRGVLLVVRNATIPREQVKQTLSGIRGVGANVIGVALNRVDLYTSGYYDYNAYGVSSRPHAEGSFPEPDTQGTLPQQR